MKDVLHYIITSLCFHSFLYTHRCIAIKSNNVKVCEDFQPILTQTIDNDGFHRILKWIIEFNNFKADVASECVMAISQEVPSGAFVNPDQIADLIRVGKISARVDGFLDVELPLHHSESQTILIFDNITQPRIDIKLPIHLRYQRPLITGGFGRVHFEYPLFLIRCKAISGIKVCGDSLRTFAKRNSDKKVIWKNVSYKKVSEQIEEMVPVGNLDHYPIVSIATFLVTCAGCVYLLSVMLSTPLYANRPKDKSGS